MSVFQRNGLTQCRVPIKPETLVLKYFIFTCKTYLYFVFQDCICKFQDLAVEISEIKRPVSDFVPLSS